MLRKLFEVYVEGFLFASDNVYQYSAPSVDKLLYFYVCSKDFVGDIGVRAVVGKIY